jgi:hypothetical protein
MKGDEEQQIPILANVQHNDPYSLQLSFVFPYESPRFKGEKSAFRAFIERTIREETPAHLVPYIQWLDQDTWSRFEAAYKDWLDTRRAYKPDAPI